MKKLRILVLLFTHGVALAGGVALGIYLLPIVIAPPAPDSAVLERAMQSSNYTGVFSRDRQDSDALHWGEGEIAISREMIAFSGELAPGPDYRLYLSPEFVETEEGFNRLKSTMVEIGSVKSFDGFLLPVPRGINTADYTAVIVWCETFGQFITSANYQ